MVGCLALISICTARAADSEIGIEATSVSASVESADYPVSYINDRAFSSASPFWSSYQGEEYYGEWEYVEMQWDTNSIISRLMIYWAESDDDNVAYPTEAYIDYWSGAEWVTSTEIDCSDINSRGIQTVYVSITSNKIRLYMRGEKACGLREILVYGERVTDCDAATLSASSTAIAFYEGDEVTLSPTVTLSDGSTEEGYWSWTLPDGTTSQESSIVATELGTYTVEYQRPCGKVSSLSYTLFDPTVSYSWPEYSPTLDYDYRTEYPDLQAPTAFLPEDNNQEGYLADGWWAVAWGPKTSSYVTDVAKQNLLDKMNEDFEFFRNDMGWPPDKRGRNGYYSTVYVYGSGLNTDSADSTATGGWQSATWYDGSSWPMVYLSYYPIACFDPNFTYDAYLKASVTDQEYQQNACVHEGIHAIFADLDGCKNAAWYHEAGNTWLQSEAEVQKTGEIPESMGYLSAGNMIAPFMPIECYSGWLLDGSFGGPSAEGVNMYNDDGEQICTWRNLLGGVQYGELFPHFVAEILGNGSIPWIWRYCTNRVLDGMADTLGDNQMRRLILEYRSRQALIDVGDWNTACRALLDDNWQLSIKQEWSPYWQAVDTWYATPYVNMYECDETDSVGWYYPEYRTTPGWSGANQIPLHVSGNEGDIISIHFKPLGDNMVCQLCFRTKRGRKFYSYPVEGEGDVVMMLQDEPANNVVFAVVCNTDYIYYGEETRTAHYDYRIKMGDNVYQPATADVKWYNYASTYYDSTFDYNTAGIESVSTDEQPVEFCLNVDKTVVKAGESIAVNICAASRLQIPVVMYSMSGQKVCSHSFTRDGDFSVPASTAPGVYVLTAYNGSGKSSVKIVVER